MNFTNVKIKAHPVVWDLAKLNIGVIGPKYLPSCNSSTRIPILTNKSSFLQNIKLNKLHYLNIRIYLQLVVWGLKTRFGSTGTKRLMKS